MAAYTEIRLGRQRFVTRDRQLAITVTATAELAWSSAEAAVLGPVAPAARVAQLVRAGRLWVGCGGSAFGLVVYPTLQRQVLCGAATTTTTTTNAHHHWLAQAVLDWPWAGLGLLVRPDTERWLSGNRRWDVPRLFFAVSHPASPGGLCAPAGIPQAQFRRVVCHLNFVQRPTARPGWDVALPAKKARSRKKRPEKRETAADTVDRPTQPASTVFDEPALRAQAASLVEASLHVLVGVKRRVLGVLPVGSHPAQPLASLISIAPAVWNYGHFQAVAARAALVPTISRLLANFSIDAESARLQDKPGGKPNTQLAVQDMEAKLHEIVLKGVPTSPAAKKRKAKAGPKARSAQHESEQAGPSGAGMPRPDAFSVDDGEPYAVVDEGIIHAFQDGCEDEHAVCWQDIEEWPEAGDSWPWDEMDSWDDGQEDNGRWPGEDAFRVYDVDEMDNVNAAWQEVENWQLEGWEADGTGDPWQAGEEADENMGYMDIDEDGVDMWQDGDLGG